MPNNIEFPCLDVADFVTTKNDEPDFDVLIGMDILTQGDLSLTMEMGNTVISFRKPHAKHCIDYTQYIEENDD
jgi:hypothetical protein